MKGKIFRIGHMGTVSNEEIAGGIATVERVLKQNGALVKTGAWLEAWNAKMQ